jgi:hypothetical protein
MNKKNRRAWLRIIEAFLAVLIIFGAVLVILSKQPTGTDISEGVYERQRQILEIISKNDSLRSEIINEKNEEINNTISKIIPASWNFATNICDLNEICSNPGTYENKNIYATEVIITSNLTKYNPKKLRFFVWGK